MGTSHRVWCWPVLCALPLLGCRGAEEKVEAVSQAVGHGKESEHKAAVAVITAKGLVGSGAFVKKRCVLTAGHNLSADGYAVVQSAGKGKNTLKDATCPLDHPDREDKLKDVAPQGLLNDLALVWTKGPGDNKRPDIDHKGYTPYAIEYTDEFNKTELKMIGYGYGDACKKGTEYIQREGLFESTGTFGKTTVDKEKVQDKGFFTELQAKGKDAGGGNVYLPCAGDSGAPYLKSDKIVSVHFGATRADDKVAGTILLRPYKPWLEDRLENFCVEKHKQGVDKQSNAYPFRVEGYAYTNAMSGTKIIDCGDGSPGDCSQGYAWNLITPEGRADQLNGVGHLTLEAKPVEGYCFVKWTNAGTAACRCDGAETGVDFTSSVCTVQLIAHGEPGATEDFPMWCYVEYAPEGSPQCGGTTSASSGSGGSGGEGSTTSSGTGMGGYGTSGMGGYGTSVSAGTGMGGYGTSGMGGFDASGGGYGTSVSSGIGGYGTSVSSGIGGYGTSVSSGIGGYGTSVSSGAGMGGYGGAGGFGGGEGGSSGIGVGGSGPALCDHPATTEGLPLDPSCDPDIAAVCAADSYCCTQAWDEACITEYVATISVNLPEPP